MVISARNSVHVCTCNRRSSQKTNIMQQPILYAFCFMMTTEMVIHYCILHVNYYDCIFGDGGLYTVFTQYVKPVTRLTVIIIIEGNFKSSK